MYLDKYIEVGAIALALLLIAVILALMFLYALGKKLFLYVTNKNQDPPANQPVDPETAHMLLKHIRTKSSVCNRGSRCPLRDLPDGRKSCDTCGVKLPLPDL